MVTATSISVQEINVPTMLYTLQDLYQLYAYNSILRSFLDFLNFLDSSACCAYDE